MLSKCLLNAGMTEMQKDINETKEGGKEKANCLLLPFILPSRHHPLLWAIQNLYTLLYSVFQVYLFLFVWGFSHLDAQHLKCRDYVCLDSQRLAPCLTVNKMWLNKFLEGLIYPTLRNYLGSSNLEVLVNIWIGFLWLKFDRLDKQISDKIWSK